MMIEFERLINNSEISHQYFNLTDTKGRKYGRKLGEPGKILTVIDGQGRRSEMRRHNANQLTQCSVWFKQNAIKPDSKISFRFDDESGVLHLGPASNSPAVQIPVLATVAFSHGGKQYEIRCTRRENSVRVVALLDGRQAMSFEL